MDDIMAKLQRLEQELHLKSEETLELFHESLDYSEKALKYLSHDGPQWTEEEIRQAYQKARAPILENLALKVKSKRYLKQNDCITNRPVINLATLGEATHGKSTLTSAITKYCALMERGRFYTYDEIDHPPEEQRVNESTDRKQVEFETEKHYYKVVDIPGNPQYINYIFGIAPNIDAAILVISVCEYNREQTEIHLAIARSIGVPVILAFLNKLDVVSDEHAHQVGRDVRNLLEAYHYTYTKPKQMILYGSARDAMLSTNFDRHAKVYEGIRELIEVLDESVQPVIPEQSQPLFMVINDLKPVSNKAFSAAVMVTGGQIEVGQHVEIVGMENLTAHVTRVEPYRSKPGEALTGSNYWITLEGVEPFRVDKGTVVSEPNTINLHKSFISELEVQDKNDFTDRWLSEVTQLFFGPRQTAGRVKVLTHHYTGQSGRIKVEVDLDQPTAIHEGERFGIAAGRLSFGMGTVGKIIK